MIRRTIYATAFVLLAAGCKETSGPAIAVTLELHSVDGVVVPAPLLSPFGKPATVGRGFLQGTNWGAACGFAVGLSEGPITFLDVPDCRLKPGEERKFKITVSDSRFPAGTLEYRFLPE